MRRLALPPRKILERDVAAEFVKYLKAERLHYLRTNAGLAWKRGYPIHMAEKGTPDFVVFVPGGRQIINPWTGKGETCPVERAVWVEIKKGSESKLSKEQLDFKRAVIGRKGLFYRINSADDIRLYFPPQGELALLNPPGEHVERRVTTEVLRRVSLVPGPRPSPAVSRELPSPTGQ